MFFEKVCVEPGFLSIDFPKEFSYSFSVRGGKKDLFGHILKCMSLWKYFLLDRIWSCDRILPADLLNRRAAGCAIRLLSHSLMTDKNQGDLIWIFRPLSRQHWWPICILVDV